MVSLYKMLPELKLTSNPNRSAMTRFMISN